MTGPLLQISGLTKKFGEHRVLNGIDLDVHRGEIVMVLGPSGSGKSTLLRCINMIEWPSAGSVVIEGVNMVGEPHNGTVLPDKDRITARKRQHVGMVFQRFNLFGHLSAVENVMIGLVHVLGMRRADARERALSELRRVHLESHVDKRPNQLSGGQQQRVAIARAMAMRPKLMLFDEPTSALDPELVGEVLSVIRELADEGMTMLVVTHEMRFAREIGSRIVFMDAGSIVEEAPPDLFFSAPTNGRTRDFLRRLQAG